MQTSDITYDGSGTVRVLRFGANVYAPEEIAAALRRLQQVEVALAACAQGADAMAAVVVAAIYAVRALHSTPPADALAALTEAVKHYDPPTAALVAASEERRAQVLVWTAEESESE